MKRPLTLIISYKTKVMNVSYGPQFLSCLKFQQNLARGGARESPSCLLWCYYLLAAHLDRVQKYDKVPKDYWTGYILLLLCSFVRISCDYVICH